MTTKIFSYSEREKLNRVPEDLASDDLIAFFTLSENDGQVISKMASDTNRLGVAFLLCCLRFMGFYPDPPYGYPLEFVARQLDVDAQCFSKYGNRKNTKAAHREKIQKYLGFSKVTPMDFALLKAWLVERAMKHDRPHALFRLACEKLYGDKLVRPGISVLERLVTTARAEAARRVYDKMEALICSNKPLLDSILTVDQTTKRTLLTWLRTGAVSNTPSSILQTCDKLRFLRHNGVTEWKLDALNPNRRKFLAGIGRKSSNQMLQRMDCEKRYPIIVSFLAQSLEDVTDELADLFIRCLSDTYSRSKRKLERFHLDKAASYQRKMRMLELFLGIILDDNVPEESVRKEVYQNISPRMLKEVMAQCRGLARPKNDKHYDYFAKNYSMIRRFAPAFLEVMDFQSNIHTRSLLSAIELLKRLNSEQKRKVDADVSLDFVSKAWEPYLCDGKGNIVRRYFELCVLWELKKALKSGNIWLKHSRRYADLETYLIPRKQWAKIRKEACELLGSNPYGEAALRGKAEKLSDALKAQDRMLDGKTEGIRVENGKLVVTGLKAEKLPDGVATLEKAIAGRLPKVELADLLIEVDSWTGFGKHLKHAAGSQPRSPERIKYLYACLLAQACNFGLEKMAEASSLSYNQLAWHGNWYLREETLQKAVDQLVNYQYRQPLSGRWGTGTLSSSDGQRFPVPVKARNAARLARYFGYGKGLTAYTWTSDQLSQYGFKPIPSTARDAPYVLDAIIDNETELNIMEHTTDTLGYTEIVFALFDLLGMRFMPRIRDLGDQRIFRSDKSVVYKSIESALSSPINFSLIAEGWDELLRIAASLKMGWVTASLLIAKLQAHPQNVMTKFLQEYGRLIKSIYIPGYLCEEEQQRKVSRQLNKGESLHTLRQFLFFANEGQMRKAQIEDQVCQTGCLTLVTNAVIVWNTRYMQAAIDELKTEGFSFYEDYLSHIYPCRFEHINKYGRYNFNVEEELKRKGLRELRKPS